MKIGKKNTEKPEQLSSTAVLMTVEMFLFSDMRHSEEKFTTLIQ